MRYIIISCENETMDNVYSFGFRFRNLLNKPFKVFFICLCLFLVSLFFNGAIWRIWSLHRDANKIQEQIYNSRKQAKALYVQIKQAKDPSYIERQAKDKLDMVDENDMVFVFSE